MTVRILEGDCLDLMPTLDADSVDAIVTDPPYGLSFMGKDWDHGVPGVPFWIEAYRVLKPGGHLLAFGGTRTHHRLAVAIEDAGFEIRDCLMWLYGSGFPKSLDVSKAIDKATGAVRELTRPGVVQRNGYGEDWDTGSSDSRPRYDSPATDEARQWQGWGTALKPAWEPIILARKPLIGSVAANVLAHGTGGLNIDGCRIEAPDADLSDVQRQASDTSGYRGLGASGYHSDHVQPKYNGIGRWPANLLLDEDAAALLDAQSGERRSAGDYPTTYINSTGELFGNIGATQGRLYADKGGASRFFFVSQGDDQCKDAKNAALNSNPQNERGDFARSDAAMPAENGQNCQEPSTNAMPSGSRQNGGNATPTIQPTALEFWPEPAPTNTLSSDRANDAATRKPTVITTTTADRSMFGFSADVAISSSTPPSAEVGEAAYLSGNRFWYTTKASRSERNKGLDGLPERTPHPDEPNGRAWDIPGSHSTPRANHHPTVKPLDLMQWLCRLVTPPGGTILDPFAGSGSTLVAADREGFHAIGIELNPEYAELARRRVAGDAPLLSGLV